MDNDFEGDGGDGKIEDKIDGNACAKSTANPRVISASKIPEIVVDHGKASRSLMSS